VRDGSAVPIPGRHRFEVHEVALSALGSATTLALLAAGQLFNPVILDAIGPTFLFATVIFTCRGRTGRSRIRLFASFGFVVWFYFAISRITPALGTKLRDGALLAIDEAMFGKTPAIFWERAATAWLTNLMSLCYMTYHFYLAVAVGHAGLVPNVASQRLSVYLFTGFAIGFAGYLLVPAVGPARAYPELFRGPLPGGTPARLIAEVAAAGSSGYDVFPSLHVLITCILLDHDWRQVRRRFWMMVVPSLGLLISTVYLRYHYGVDVLAGFLLFLALRQTFLKVGRREARMPE
jgi:hypothetical protein